MRVVRRRRASSAGHSLAIRSSARGLHFVPSKCAGAYVMEGANFCHVFDKLLIGQSFEVSESSFHEDFELVFGEAVEVALSAWEKRSVGTFGAFD